MPKSGNFRRKHFWTENKPAKFWESPPHVALATHGCARGRMEIKHQLCARKHIYNYISNEVKKLSLSGKRRAMVEKPVLFAAAAAQPSVHSAQCTVTVHSSQWSSNRHGSCSAFVSPLSSLKTVTSVKEASFV